MVLKMLYFTGLLVHVLLCSPNIHALHDCSEHLNAGSNIDGVYEIQPKGVSTPFKVYCEMDNGAWTRIQHREDGFVNFFRTYADYQAGFGLLTAGHWLGNEHIHTLTNQYKYKLRIDFILDNGTELYVEYSSFSINSQSDLYRLNISGFSGTVSYDALGNHNGYQFRTYDRDTSDGCARKYHGGWWYHTGGCLHGCTNGQFRYNRTCNNVVPGARYGSGCITWYSLAISASYNQPIRRTTMKVKQSNFTILQGEQMTEPDLVITLDGNILSDGNETIPAGCADEYANSLNAKAMTIRDVVNVMIGSDLCTGIPAANISHLSTVISTSGYQGTATIKFKQPGNEFLPGYSQKQCVNAIGRFLQDHANWLRPLIDVIPTCPVVYFTSEMFNLTPSRSCVDE